MYPYNYKFGQKIQTIVDGFAVDRGFVAHIVIEAADAVAQSITGVLQSTPLTSAEQVITENITSPSIPRNIKVKGNAADIAGNVVVTGTNYDDEAITEIIALNGITEVQGNKAFKTVAQIELPIEIHVGTDTVSVGFVNKLGLPYKLSLNTVLAAYRDKVKEGTAPTVAVDEANIENNTVLLNSALNGTQIDITLIV